ncbi:MAG TPA: serine hydrolase [Saprospiraceae bacterium]|nr:serine hydrolase [Saprospiraceae bacterium]
MKIYINLLVQFAFSILIFSSCEKEYEFSKSNNTTSFPSANWIQVSNVADYGWSIEKLESAEKFSKTSGTKSVMIIENGKLIYSWGDCEEKYYVASIRKSFLSMIYGYYINSKISLDATLSDYNIDDKSPQLNDFEKTATIRNLLTSSSGVFHKAAAADEGSIPERNSKHHGEEFYYNNWGFNALGTIFEQQTGQKIFQVFNDSIGSKIGLQDFNRQSDGRYDFSDVSIHPAYHFDMTTRDMARIGLLVLNKGNWDGKQIISKDWIDTITSKKITVSKDYGGGSYGYMWWVNDGSYMADFADVSNDAYSAQGHWSQLILIIPGKNLVIVHRAKKNLDPSRPLLIIKMILNAKK